MTLYSKLERTQKELLEANRKLELLATKDGLTGLYNRRYFDKRLEEEIAVAHRYQKPLSLIMIDGDRFKRLNDHGHQVGDLVLQVLAVIFNTVARETDIIGRYGGEEFVIICPNTAVDGLGFAAERLRFAVERDAADLVRKELEANGIVPIEPLPINFSITISLGGTEMLDYSDQKEINPKAIAMFMVGVADSALANAKASGRNQYCFESSSVVQTYS